MIRFPLFIYLCLALVAPPAAIYGESLSPESVPDRNTPKELAEAWLRFHELELCQGMDAVFVFSRDGMKIRALVEDEKSYQKLEELVAPLRSSFNIELEPKRPQQEAESDDRREPPASLWENYELRSYMGDRIARIRERPGFDEDEDQPRFADPVLKQRLLLYADEILSWNRKVERYSEEIPSLTREALDPALVPEFRARANSICMAHAQNLGKYTEKLQKNLEPAFPHSRGKNRPPPSEKNTSIPKTSEERADQLSDSAAAVTRSVYRFIHPEHYSVGVDELRRPGLIDSLSALQKENSEFRKFFAKAK